MALDDVAQHPREPSEYQDLWLATDVRPDAAEYVRIGNGMVVAAKPGATLMYSVIKMCGRDSPSVVHVRSRRMLDAVTTPRELGMQAGDVLVLLPDASPDSMQVLAELASERHPVMIPPLQKERVAFSEVLEALNDRGDHVAIHHHYANGVHLGDKFTTNIKDSNVGAAAIGHGATATGSVTVAHGDTVSQEDYEQRIDGARKALIDDSRLEQLGAGVSEALGQFLRTAKQIQLDQMDLKVAQEKVKDVLDDRWVQDVLPELRGGVLPEGLAVIKALLSSPVTAVIAEVMATGFA